MFSKFSKGTLAKYGLLQTDAGDASVSMNDLIQQHSLKRSQSIWKITALVELLVIATLLVAKYSPTNSNFRFYSLVNPILSYENRVFHSGWPGDLSGYQGPPSAEVDAAWDTLFDGTIIQITPEEERTLPNRTAPLPGNAGGYIAGLEVVHHLHCLNAMRKTLWPEYYGPSFDIRRNASAFKHQEHCIELLRQVHICNPDTTITIIQWDPVKRYMVIPTDIQHTCVDYKRIQEWMKSRPVGEFNPDVYIDGGPVYQGHK